MMYPSLVANVLIVFVSVDVLSAQTIHFDQRHVEGHRLGCSYQNYPPLLSSLYWCDSSDNTGYRSFYGTDASCNGEGSQTPPLTYYNCSSPAQRDSYYSYTLYEGTGCNDNDIKSYEAFVMQTCVEDSNDEPTSSYMLYCMTEWGLQKIFLEFFFEDDHEVACRAMEYPATFPGGGARVDICIGGGQYQVHGDDMDCPRPAESPYCTYFSGYEPAIVKKNQCKAVCGNWKSDCITALGEEYIDHCKQFAKTQFKQDCWAYVADGTTPC